MLSGVTSTNSSFPINSIDCSNVNVVTGTNLTASSDPEALVLVNFLPLQTFISKSSALEYAPYKGEIESRSRGSIVSFEQGEAIAYGLFNAQERGKLEVYFFPYQNKLLILTLPWALNQEVEVQ